MAERRVRVDLDEQILELIEAGEVLRRLPISSSAKGAGELEGSERTPRGRHAIREKVGAGAAPGTVFESRAPTGEICTPERFAAEPERDWITTRILWLDGQEPGRNRGGARDSHARFIYIHGSPDEGRLGTPASHGCIRMRDADVCWLFDRVEVGTVVEIEGGEAPGD